MNRHKEPDHPPTRGGQGQGCSVIKGDEHVIRSREELYKETSAQEAPFRWRSLSVDKYDDTIDLDEHIDAYVTQLNLFTNNHHPLPSVPNIFDGKLGPFSNSLCKWPLASMDELIAQASGYIQMEEIVEYQDGVRVEHQATTNERSEGEPRINQRIGKQGNGGAKT
ncbi:hypothetical protein CR513_34429, partial [Mucuna pruriens]